MTFTPEIWKNQVSERLGNFGDWLKKRGEREVPNLIYGGLCGMTLWPLVLAAQSGLSMSGVFTFPHLTFQEYLAGAQAGIRDLELLKSALGAPAATYGGEFLHTDIYEMAAAYLFHLAKNHPFIDGNKRVGAVSALVFLAMSGYDFDAPEEDFAEMVLSVAGGELGKSGVVDFIRRWTTAV